ncbi:MAG: sugar transferase [Pseudomonadota bacterium]
MSDSNVSFDNFAGRELLAKDVTFGQADLSYLTFKRCMDVLVAAAALPFVIMIAIILVPINAVFNPGSLIFTQRRMGQHCREFTIYKFRSMLPATYLCRGPEEPLEVDRITPFGMFLRRTRMDELPQLLNVLRGDMSLIGPRPDAIEHASTFISSVARYRDRYVARPGITGLAQVYNGYAEGGSATRRKAHYDSFYIRRADWRLDFAIALRTIRIIVTGFGAR